MRKRVMFEIEGKEVDGQDISADEIRASLEGPIAELCANDFVADSLNVKDATQGKAHDWRDSLEREYANKCSEWRRAIKDIKPQAEIIRLEKYLTALDVIRGLEAAPEAAEDEKA